MIEYDPIENIRVGDIVIARWEQGAFKAIYVLKVTANNGEALLDKTGGAFPSEFCKFFIMKDEKFLEVTSDLQVMN